MLSAGPGSGGEGRVQDLDMATKRLNLRKAPRVPKDPRPRRDLFFETGSLTKPEAQHLKLHRTMNSQNPLISPDPDTAVGVEYYKRMAPHPAFTWLLASRLKSSFMLETHCMAELYPSPTS